MTPSTAQLPATLKKLCLGGMLTNLDVRAREAKERDLSYDQFLLLMAEDEIERRNARRIEYRLERAGFEGERTLENFNFQFDPKIPAAQIRALANCAFIERKENVCLVGKPGTGKSHVGQALGHNACRAGHTVVRVIAAKMFDELSAARADHSREEKLRRLLAPDLLIIDGFGLRPLKGFASDDFHQLVDERYQRGSVLLTSNRSVGDWLALFDDPVLASSAMDRLCHNAHQLTFAGRSFRNQRSLKQSDE